MTCCARRGKPPTLLRIRSIVGLLPLIAAEIVPDELFQRFPAVSRPRRLVHPASSGTGAARRQLARAERLRATVCWRSCADAASTRSDAHARRDGVSYRPTACARCRAIISTILMRSRSPARRSASNTSPAKARRGSTAATPTGEGPVWAPINFLLIQALRKLQPVLLWRRFPDRACPTGSQKPTSTSGRRGRRIVAPFQSLFLKDADGPPALSGGDWPLFDDDPQNFRDRVAVLRIFSRRHRARLRRLASNRLDGVVAALMRTPKSRTEDAPIEH